MRYHLSYHPTSGAVRIDEMGATIQTREVEQMVIIFSANQLHNIIPIAKLIMKINQVSDNPMTVEDLINTLKTTELHELPELIINLCDL